ncbi:MAG: transcriptional regulator [Firmicutes bacterium]|nr:transcriptional regulator [Bacillota bacterium]
MDFVRIGEKLIDKERIYKVIDRILEMRCRGGSQQEVADKLGIDRTFISRLETLGEVRKGGRIALVGFPILNKAELEALAREEGVDYVLILTDEERWAFVKNRSGIDLFNEVMALIMKLKHYDSVIFLGSDLRVGLAESILGDRVIPIILGTSPMKEDKYVDPGQIRGIIRELRG